MEIVRSTTGQLRFPLFDHIQLRVDIVHRLQPVKRKQMRVQMHRYRSIREFFFHLNQIIFLTLVKDSFELISR